MDYLLHEQLKEEQKNKDVLMTDEMLFALIADIVLAGTIQCISLFGGLGNIFK